MRAVRGNLMGESVAVACLAPGAVLLCRFADCRVLRHSRRNCANESMCALSSLGPGRLALVTDMWYASVQSIFVACSRAVPGKSSSSRPSWSCRRGTKFDVRTVASRRTPACTSAQDCLPEKTRMARCRPSGRWTADVMRHRRLWLGGTRVYGRASHGMSMWL